MRNQYMAKVLVHNKVVSEDQVKAHWGGQGPLGRNLRLDGYRSGSCSCGNLETVHVR